MNKQMTAVEWLADNIHYLHSTKWNYILQKAKEMEKKQIIDACNQVEVIGLDHELAGEKYYNKTFNK